MSFIWSKNMAWPPKSHYKNVKITMQHIREFLRTYDVTCITHKTGVAGIRDHRSSVGERKPRITSEGRKENDRGANCKLREQSLALRQTNSKS